MTVARSGQTQPIRAVLHSSYCTRSYSFCFGWKCLYSIQKLIRWLHGSFPDSWWCSRVALIADSQLFGASCSEKYLASSGPQSSDSSCAGSPNSILTILYNAKGIPFSNTYLCFINLGRPFQDWAGPTWALDLDSLPSPYSKVDSISLQHGSDTPASKWWTACDLWFAACRSLVFLFSNSTLGFCRSCTGLLFLPFGLLFLSWTVGFAY